MITKLKLKIDTASLKQVIREKQDLIMHNIKQVIVNEAADDLVNKIMEGFDGLSQRASMLPEDPTNPANWREEFRISLLEDILETISFTNNRIVFHVGNKDFLGYDADDDSSDSSPLKWLVFYIEGLAGDWAFISPETYQKFRKGSTYQSDWGRFGQGFMISKEQYLEEGWNSVIPFEQVRHPFSGYSPVDIFTEALMEWRLRPFIEKAIRAAVRGIDL